MQRWLAVLRPYVEAGARLVLLISLAAATVLFARHVVQALGYRYPLDYGEAPLVDQALRLAAGQGIYRADLTAPPYTISNYPPLYPLALAVLVKVFGPSLMAGRLLSVLCAILTAVLLGKIISLFTRDRVAAIAAGLIFLAFPYVLGWSKLARVDLLALVLSIGGLYMLARWSASWQGIVGGGLLLVAAIYTRQSYALAAPLAACVWLWTRNRRSAIALAALVGGLSLALFLGLNTLTQGGFAYNIITANINDFRTAQLARWWRDLRGAAPILLLLGIAFLTLARRQLAIWPLLAPYLIAAALSALTIGKIGSNMNYLLELSAALSLVAGAYIAWPDRAASSVRTAPSGGHPWLRSTLLLLLAWQTGLLMGASQRAPIADLQWRIAQPQSAFTELERIVADADGPILADEFMGLLTLQNKPLIIQPFEVTQLADAGIWDQAPLLADIRARTFPAIFIHHFRGYPVYQERWTPEMLDAIMAHYEPTAFLAETIVYRPSDPGAAQPAGLTACPASPWRLPTRSELGVWWFGEHLAFMGKGYEGDVPVYAVADGLLMRLSGWRDAVAIQHDDPLRNDQKVWTFYSGMARVAGGQSLIEPRFTPGQTAVPVKQGQLLGYQGQFAAQFGAPFWVHLHFAVVPAEPDGAFPVELVEVWLEGPRDQTQAGQPAVLNPAPYLGIADAPDADRTASLVPATWAPLHCAETDHP